MRCEALDRVGAVERLVEHEHGRVLHEGGGHLGALAHALAEPVHATGRPRAASSTVASARSTASRVGRCRGGRPRSGTAARGVSPIGTASSSGTRARPVNTERSWRGLRPEHGDRALVHGQRPVMARISVVLPAPLGPRRPVTPGPNEQLSSDRATFWPNHTDTRSATTVASATKAGSRPSGPRRAAGAAAASAGGERAHRSTSS